jgi:hypothetical protein
MRGRDRSGPVEPKQPRTIGRLKKPMQVGVGEALGRFESAMANRFTVLEQKVDELREKSEESRKDSDKKA